MFRLIFVTILFLNSFISTTQVVWAQIQEPQQDAASAPNSALVDKNSSISPLPDNRLTTSEVVDPALEPASQDQAQAQPDPAQEPQVANPAPTPAAVDAVSLKRQVKAVEVKGNKSIGLPVILSKIKTRVGQDYNQSMISDDLKRLYNTGYFADVSVDRQDVADGYRVIFIVAEKEIVDQITFSKLKYFNPNGILRKIKTVKGKFLDSKTLNDDIRTIEEMYTKKGLTQARVSVETDRDELNNKINVHFIINEGYQVKIKRIYVDGNTAFKDARIIKVMKSRWAWTFNSGFLKSEILDEDMERIKAFYEKEGFIDAAASYDVEELSESLRLVKVQIHEGQRYYVNSVDIIGTSIIAKDRVQDVMSEIKPKGIFSRDKLTVDISNIRSLYFDEGYIFVNVRESTSLNTESGRVDVRLDITEGSLAYINQIKVQGNDRTRDIVIRRELRLFPGDKFDGSKLRRSKERLRGLGYFDDVNYDIEDTDIPEKKNLIVQVKEAKTGSFSFGAGYSTVDQFVGFAEIEQRNFDFTNWPTFTGGGQALSLRLETGSTRSNTRLSFTEPWLFDYPVSAGFDAYITEHERERDVGYAYDERRIGGSLRLGRRLGEYSSGGLTFRREKIKIGNFDDDVTADLRAEQGENTVSVIGLNLARDTRNSAFAPTEGLYLSGGFDVAGGVMGGDKDFYRFTTRDSYNIPFKFNSTLEFRLRVGLQDSYGDSEKVPIFERFFAGGSRTIRGYDEREVGPVDPVTNDPIGGESMLIGNIEYTVPLIDFLKLALFYDTGNVWSRIEDFGSGQFKSGAGFGFRVKTPIGPVNLDYGIPFDDVPGEEKKSGKFYFSVSRGF